MTPERWRELNRGAVKGAETLMLIGIGVCLLSLGFLIVCVGWWLVH